LPALPDENILPDIADRALADVAGANKPWREVVIMANAALEGNHARDRHQARRLSWAEPITRHFSRGSRFVDDVTYSWSRHFSNTSPRFILYKACERCPLAAVKRARQTHATD
jgi:hypothetical protein